MMISIRPFTKLSARGLRWYTKNYYEILKINKSASAKEIKMAFLQLSKKLHPDKCPNDSSSHARFIELNEAYNILSKQESRQTYDEKLARSYSNYKHKTKSDQTNDWEEAYRNSFYDHFRYDNKRYNEQEDLERAFSEFQNELNKEIRRINRLTLLVLSSVITFMLLILISQVRYASYEIDEKELDEILQLLVK